MFNIISPTITGRERAISYPWDYKLSLKTDERQVGQRHEDVERKQEFHHIFIFYGRTQNFTSRKKRASEHHNDGTF